VIDEVFARKYFGNADPIGQRIVQDGSDPQQIVGVVGHVKQWSLNADESQTLQAQLYEPFRQVPVGWAGVGCSRSLGRRPGNIFRFDSPGNSNQQPTERDLAAGKP